jgi:sugar lactone lactonase YvrE
LAAAALLALTLLLIVPGPARASGIETGPQGIAVDSSGDVYVSDWSRNTIDEITPQGVSIVAGIPGEYGSPTPGPATSSTLNYPIGLAVSAAGDLYIVDFGNNVIEKVTPSGTLSIVAGEVGQRGTPTPGPATSSMLAAPIGVAVDSSGNVYIADQGTQHGPNNVIEKVTPSGTLSIFAGELGASGSPTPGPATDSKLNYPQDVAVDGAGNVYIADVGNGVVEKVNSGGDLSIYAEVYSPQGVATDSSGDVYVADMGNNRVEKIDPADQLSIIAGNGQAGEPTPGPATSSMLNLPDAVAVDSPGTCTSPIRATTLSRR